MSTRQLGGYGGAIVVIMFVAVILGYAVFKKDTPINYASETSVLSTTEEHKQSVSEIPPIPTEISESTESEEKTEECECKRIRNAVVDSKNGTIDIYVVDNDEVFYYSNLENVSVSISDKELDGTYVCFSSNPRYPGLGVPVETPAPYRIENLKILVRNDKIKSQWEYNIQKGISRYMPRDVIPNFSK